MLIKIILINMKKIIVLAFLLPICLSAQVIIPSPFTVASTALPQAAALSSYSASFSIVGCASPWVWSVAPGSALPGGLSLNQAGQITGTLINGGNYSFNVQAWCGGIFAVNAPVTLKGSHAVALTWTGANGVAAYNVYRSPKTGSEGTTPINSSPVTSTAWTDAAVTPGATYYYVVKSVGASGSLSPPCTEASVKIPNP